MSLSRTLIREAVERSEIAEAVQLHGFDLFCYAAVVTEAYGQAPVNDERAKAGFDALNQSNAMLFKRLSADIDVSFTPDDNGTGLSSFNQMADTIINKKKLDVYTGGGEHPMMTQEQNTIFRTVHDYYAHTGPIRKDFLKNPTQPVKRNNFKYRGEINAYLTHARLAPRAAVPVLFTEVVGQSSHYLITRNYVANQKAAILDGFDYIQIGRMNGDRQQRFNQIKQELSENGQVTIQADGGSFTIQADKINWKLLSMSGTAGAR